MQSEKAEARGDPQRDSELRVQLEGPADARGRLELRVFSRFLADFRGCLTHVERTAVTDLEHPASYRIAHISSGSAQLAIETIADKPHHSRAVTHGMLNALRALQQEGKRPEGFDADALNAFAKLPEYLQDGIQRISVSSTSRAVAITPQLLDNIQDLLGAAVETQGSLSGRLEYVNLHRQTSCRIYPNVGSNYVTCTFPMDLLDRVTKGLGRYVTVSGALKYLPEDAFPHEIQVKDIRVHPPNEHLPTLSDLRGVAPNITGGEDTVSYLRRLRENDG